MIFISYASEDEPIASKLYQLLKSKKLNVWMDKKELKPGQEWETQIWRAATSADFFCLLLSPRSVNKRGFIRKEVRFALDKWKEKLPEDIYLIPCRIERAEPPFELKHLQYTDLNTDSDYTSLVDLLTELENKLAQRELPQSADQYVGRSTSWQTSSVDVELEFPEFTSTDLVRLNAAVDQMVSKLKDEAAEFNSDPIGDNVKSSYQSSFSVFASAPNVVSVLFLVSWYGSGAAHPNHGYRAINYNRMKGRTFSLKDAFSNPDEALQIVSQACRHDLLKQWSLRGVLPDENSEQWVGEGAGPNWDNFENCIFHDGLLRIYFDPYSVGPYAWGARIVSIDLPDLQDLLAADFVTG
ncbi:TIR domain-containing protein [Bradyrhizobium vignae]|uniref:TIR domain-containing protein n=1 Tax=Bradyrhizobium vignae TaxID=1549949 RepID=A0A2U3PWY2_9BRAD|nr:TIR domain-containing protein [Bradyrhizobium vignae]SPP93665.1 conserved protein of unknown function [Bradyrhizobium vignae]